MSYEVTATRKRPRNFDDLTGQEFVVATLKNSMSSGRIAHAYLFSGPRGVGKTSAARILAKALNCPTGPSGEPCDDYPGSVEITRGTSMDVIEIDGASNTSVNDVRQIKDEVLFAPNSSRYKIYIIDEVHMLSNSAFNALLKTIEEPPPYIVFIFATTEIHKVPATIRSRCQQFNFRLIPLETIRETLRAVCSETEITTEEEALFWIAKEARGSLRDAYTLFDQVVAFSDGSITFEKIRGTLGVGSIEQINRLAEAFVEGDGGCALEILSEVMTAGVSEEQLVTDLAEYFRSVLFLKHGVRKESVLGYPPERFSTAVVESFTESQLQHALGLLVELFRNMRYSVNQRFELDLVVSRLAALSGYLTSSEILARITELKRGLAEAPAAQTARLAASTPPTPSTNPATPVEPVSEAPRLRQVESEKIDEIVTSLREKRPTLASVLEHAISWDLGETELVITVDSAFAVGSIEQEMATVREVVRIALNEPVLVKVRSKPRTAEAQAQHSEQVEMVRQVFRGEVVDS